MSPTDREEGEPPDLEQPRPGPLDIPYAPDGAEAVENPPRFTWMPEPGEDARYVLRLSTDPGFASDKTHVFEDLPFNFFTPDRPFPPGRYLWSYARWSARTGRRNTRWSRPRSFTLRPGLPETPLPARAARHLNVRADHPRLWLNPDRLATFRAKVSKDSGTSSWDVFLRNSVIPWMERDIMHEPAGYPGGERSARVWRQTYIACQELIYAIRHLAVGARVSGDRAMLDRARAWLLAAASWDPDGATSHAYCDEWAFRVTVALAWGYDWLHEALDESDRQAVLAALLARTRQVAEHVIQRARPHLHPYDSHAVRAVPSVLVPACIAMHGEAPETRDWLDYAIEFLATVHSPWGDEDGGWAEGPHYWMTGMAAFTEAANLLRNHLGIDLYRRPFLQKTADFPLFTKAPRTRRGTFGDDSTIGDEVCLKIGQLAGQFASVTGNGVYQWYSDAIIGAGAGTERKFYNYGWWDLDFDALTARYDNAPARPVPPANLPELRWFRGVGWACIQHRMDDPGNHIQFNFKSSPYGSLSHSHADQNAFCLSAFGEDLAIQSGHYVAFNSQMHRNWRRQTRSKNAVLINGKGQYAGRDKAAALAASGRIVAAETRPDHIFVRGDATAAYRSLSPEVASVLRDVLFVAGRFVVIIDRIDADAPVEIDWLLHAPAPMRLAGSTFRYSGERASLKGKILRSRAGPPVLSQQTGFPDVDPAEYEGLPVSTCLRAHFPNARTHRIVTLLLPCRRDDRSEMSASAVETANGCELRFSISGAPDIKIPVPDEPDPAG